MRSSAEIRREIAQAEAGMRRAAFECDPSLFTSYAGRKKGLEAELAAADRRELQARRESDMSHLT